MMPGIVRPVVAIAMAVTGIVMLLYRLKYGFKPATGEQTQPSE